MIRLLILLLLLSPPLYAQCTWEVRDSIIGRPFERWEATAYIASECDPQYALMRDRMLDSLVRFTGVNRLRVEVRAGSENPVDHYAEWRAAGCPTGADPAYTRWLQNRYVTVNDNSDSTIDVGGFHFTELDATIENVVIPLRTRLHAKGEDLQINVSYVAYTGQNASGTYLHDQPQEYAEFVSAVYQHLKTKWNIVPDRWEAVLEPDLVAEWTASKLGAALDAAALRLRSDGFEPSFIAPSTSNTSNTLSWVKDILAYQHAKSAIKELSYHRDSDSNGVNEYAVRRFADSVNIRASMLGSTPENSNPKAMMNDIIYCNSAVWHQGSIGGLFDVTTLGDSLHIVRKRNTVVTGLLSRYVKPGAVRLYVCFEVVMRNTDGSFVGYQWPPNNAFLASGWPTGEVEFVRVDTLLQEHMVRRTRTKRDSSQSDGYPYFSRRDIAFVIYIKPTVVSVDDTEDLADNVLTLSPIPARDHLTIDLPAELIDIPFTKRVLDLQGRVLVTETDSSSILPIRLTSGVYVLECMTQKNVWRQVFVVE
ncbi:MAG: T9SS type A sorting domain-containing protein [Ignavibacteria bacterium]|nr:T9SS type A sorting domain-containing protein [Ignavibacteria bacterium]